MDTKLLLELIDTEINGLLGITEAKKSAPCDVPSDKMIPKLTIAEIPWADMGEGAKKAASPERQEIEAYLSKLPQGADLPDKFKAIQDMLDGDLSAVGINVDARASIGTILSYTVFIKTLTSIVQNFNDSTAGFLFEGLLGVTAGGKQIETGAGTIADFETPMENYKRVSLKLLAEKGSTTSGGGVSKGTNVHGSFRDLVGDLQNDAYDNRMPYLVALKDFSGDGDKAQGSIKVFEFVFDQANFLNWMAGPGASSSSKATIQLASNEPIAGRKAKGKYGDIEMRGETSREIMSGEPVYHTKIDLNDWLSRAGEGEGFPPEDLRDDPHYEKAIQAGLEKIRANPEAFSDYSEDRLANTKAYAFGREIDIHKDDPRALVYLTLKRSWNEFNQQKDVKGSEHYLPSSAEEASERIKLVKWMTPEASKAELEKLSPKEMWETIEKYSKGFNVEGASQWEISQTQMAQGQKLLATLTVGQQTVLNTLEKVRGKTNEEMFRIYCELDELSVNLRGFFMQGLSKGKGNDAIANSNNIAERVKRFMGPKSEQTEG